MFGSIQHLFATRACAEADADIASHVRLRSLGQIFLRQTGPRCTSGCADGACSPASAPACSWPAW
eukprot:15435919-Alexandrium_andersonii.AAC.1